MADFSFEKAGFNTLTLHKGQTVDATTSKRGAALQDKFLCIQGHGDCGKSFWS